MPPSESLPLCRWGIISAGTIDAPQPLLLRLCSRPAARESVQDGNEQTGSNKSNHNTTNQAIGAPEPQEAAYPSSDERADNAHHDVANDAIASPTHHPAGEEARHQSHNQPCKKTPWVKSGSENKCCSSHDFILFLRQYRGIALNIHQRF